ncbi:MAG: hypothetical protein RIC55_28640 [Pirellulaceae bacterium]
MKSKRRRLLIDRPVQLGIVARLALHWATFLIAVVVALPLLRLFVFGDLTVPLTERARHAGADALILAVVFLCLFPYFMHDMLRTTNRFAGPMYRLQEAIRSTGRGKSFKPISFRSDDMWQDVAGEFNAMVGRLQDGRDASSAAEQVERQEESAAV